MRIKRSSKLERILRATETHMIRTISSATEAGLQSMKRDVPVDTGDLKSTCQKRDDGKGHTMLMAGGPSQISDNFVDYELHVEFGTVNMSAQPFFRPAIDNNVTRSKVRVRGRKHVATGASPWTCAR